MQGGATNPRQNGAGSDKQDMSDDEANYAKLTVEDHEL